MDIFRKKKIRKLLNELEDVNNILIQERCKTKKLQERINNLEKYQHKHWKKIKFL